MCFIIDLLNIQGQIMSLQTKFLQLTITNSNVTPLALKPPQIIMLDILKTTNILLLKNQELQKYFPQTQTNTTENIIFVFAMSAKTSQKQQQATDNNNSNKIKQRIVGRLKIVGDIYQMADCQIADIPELIKIWKSKDYLEFTHFVEISWMKQLEASKNKLPSDFAHLFGKKDGFHTIKKLQGYKMKDTLEYPSSMYKKIYESFEDKQYYLMMGVQTNSSISGQQSEDSDDSDQSSSGSDDSESDSQSQKSKRRRRKNSKSDKRRSRGKKNRRSDKDRHRSRDKTTTRKRDKDKDRKKDSKKDRKPDRHRSRKDKRENDRKNDKKKRQNKSKERQKDRQKQKRKKSESKQKRKRSESKKKRDTSINDNRKKSRDYSKYGKEDRKRSERSTIKDEKHKDDKRRDDKYKDSKYKDGNKSQKNSEKHKSQEKQKELVKQEKQPKDQQRNYSQEKTGKRNLPVIPANQQIIRKQQGMNTSKRIKLESNEQNSEKIALKRQISVEWQPSDGKVQENVSKDLPLENLGQRKQKIQKSEDNQVQKKDQEKKQKQKNIELFKKKKVPLSERFAAKQQQEY